MTPNNKGNTSSQRGRGYRARLNKAEQDALGEIAKAHGYEGMVIDGVSFRPAVEFTLAIIGGEVATVLLGDEEMRYAAAKLLASDDEILQEVGENLRAAVRRADGS